MENIVRPWCSASGYWPAAGFWHVEDKFLIEGAGWTGYVRARMALENRLDLVGVVGSGPVALFDTRGQSTRDLSTHLEHQKNLNHYCEAQKEAQAIYRKDAVRNSQLIGTISANHQPYENWQKLKNGEKLQEPRSKKNEFDERR
jgi:hypothetical protein